VIRIARRVGEEHGQYLEAYKTPDVFFEATSKTWVVSFTAKRGYLDQYQWAGGFGVDIDDGKKTTTYHAPIWK